VRNDKKNGFPVKLGMTKRNGFPNRSGMTKKGMGMTEKSTDMIVELSFPNVPIRNLKVFREPK
jgi:hypothetical protein